MKCIYLIRHAESISQIDLNNDYLRPLSEQGINEAQLMAKKLHNEIKDFPDLIISSSAKRTHETAKIFAKEFGVKTNKIKLIRKIYEANTGILLDIINNIPPGINSLFLIGHNPAITQFSNLLSNDNIQSIPTSGIVKIELLIDNWEYAFEGIGQKIFIIYPKMF